MHFCYKAQPSTQLDEVADSSNSNEQNLSDKIICLKSLYQVHLLKMPAERGSQKDYS